jgi:23S rRNA (pseudouridine1915-N3)-methyltransferase
MFKIKIIVVDRTRSSFIKKGESFYLDRLKHYARIEWVETRPAQIKKGRQNDEILDLEMRAILKNLKQRDYVIALDRSGKSYSSKGLSTHIQQLFLSHHRICFIIGGPLGLSSTCLKKAHEIFSLSQLTFTHEMSRLLLIEQLYRAFTIIKGEQYHK